MGAAIVNRLEAGFAHENDCAIAALACYAGVTYTDVLRVVTKVDRREGRDGLWRRTAVRVGKRLGLVLKRRRPDPDGYGLLFTHDHAAVLREGFVLDRLTVWPLDVWLQQQQVKLSECDFLVAEDE